MSAELQGLIDRIRKEGLEQAEAEAAALLADARKQAAQIHAEATRNAAALLEDGRKQAELLELRGKQNLEKAARDLLLLVRQSIERTLAGLIRQEVAGAMDATLLRDLITRVVQAYAVKAGEGVVLETLVSPEDQAALSEYFAGRLSGALREGVELRSDRGVFRGFKVSAQGGHIQNDFTADAIADAMAAMVRPALASLLRAAAGEAAPGRG